MQDLALEAAAFKNNERLTPSEQIGYSEGRPPSYSEWLNGKSLDDLVVGNDHIGLLRWDSKTQILNGSGKLWQGLDIDLPCWQLPLKSIGELFCFLHPEFESIFFRELKKCRKQASFQMPVRVISDSKNSTWLWITVNTDLLKDDGVKISILAYAMEVLPRLTKSENLRLNAWSYLFDKGTAGTYYWSIPDDRIYSYPSSWQRLGYSPEEARSLSEGESMRRWIGRIHPDDYIKIRKIVQVAILEREPFTLIYRISDKYQRYRWRQSEDKCIFNDKGELIALVGTVFDREKERSHQFYLQEQIRLLKESNRMESERLHQLSAQINTPMNTILGYSQWFDLQPHLPQQQRERINHIRHAGEHLLQLINEVIDLSKMESGELTLNSTSVNMTQLLKECLALCQPLLRSRRIRVKTHFHEDDVWQVVGDRLRLKQIFLNLINNAAKYNSDRGWIKIRIIFKRRHFLSVIVEDGGWGMSQEQLSHLFQPYNRLGAESSSEEGSGLGLAISQKLAHMMGGEIVCSSTLGEGSSFTVNLKHVSVEAESASEEVGGLHVGVNHFFENSRGFFPAQSLYNQASSLYQKNKKIVSVPVGADKIEHTNPSEGATDKVAPSKNNSVHKILYLDRDPQTSRLFEQWVEALPNSQVIIVDSLPLALFQFRNHQPTSMLLDFDGFFSASAWRNESDSVAFLSEQNKTSPQKMAINYSDMNSESDPAINKPFFEALISGDFLSERVLGKVPIIALATAQSESLAYATFPELKMLVRKVLYKPLEIQALFSVLNDIEINE